MSVDRNPFKQSDADDVFVIAEIGKSFIQTESERPVAEYLQNAKDLIDAAVEAGVDAVKFQTHEVSDEQAPIEVVSPHFNGADRHAWVTRNTRATPVEEFWKPLIAHARERGVLFFTTPMSRGAAQKLDSFDLPLWKVGSGDVQDYVLLDYLIETGKPIIISSGMVSLAELDELVAYLTGRGAQFSILYCISEYPAPAEHFNLATIERFKEKYPNVPIGFSDHSLGHDVALAAVKVGARIVEKHFSFSRELWGSDHKVSMTPDEMKAMVEAIRTNAYETVDATAYYGNPDRELEGAGNRFRPYFNKTLVAARDLPVGTLVTKDMVYAMRPRMHLDGYAANRFHEVVGKTLASSLKEHEPFTDTTFTS